MGSFFLSFFLAYPLVELFPSEEVININEGDGTERISEREVLVTVQGETGYVRVTYDHNRISS